MRRSGAAFLLTLAVAACGRQDTVKPRVEAGPPVEVRSAVDRAVATTGDLITYRIEVEHDPGYEVRLPEVGAEIAGFRIVDLGTEPERETGGRRVTERWYRLRADLVGSYVLPPVTVAYGPVAGGEGEGGVVETSAIFVEVASVLPAEGGADDIRDIKPPRRLSEPWPWLWTALAATAAALLVGWLLWRRRRSGAPSTPAEPAHEIAFAELDRLRRTDFDDPAAVRRFHFAISETVRAYVERRFAVNATDLTTEEIVAAVAGFGPLEAESRRTLIDFLRETDLVKFAHHEPARSEIEATYERALGFVEATRPRPRTEEAGAEVIEERAA